MRILQSILEIIFKTSTSIVNSAIRFVLRLICVETSPSFYGMDPLIDYYTEQAFEKFCRPTNRFLQVALYLFIV